MGPDADLLIVCAGGQAVPGSPGPGSAAGAVVSSVAGVRPSWARIWAWRPCASPFAAACSTYSTRDSTELPPSSAAPRGRKSDVAGKSVVVSVDPGGPLHLTKQNTLKC